MPDEFAGTVLIPSPEWELATQERRCRYTVGPRSKACGAHAVFALRRGRTKVLWAYCEQHIYGHVWLEDGMFFPIAVQETGWLALLEGGT